MKLLTTNGLTKLIQLIKSTFLPKTDVVEVSEVNVDTVPTQNSSNLITSGGVYNVVGDIETALATIIGD